MRQLLEGVQCYFDAHFADEDLDPASAGDSLNKGRHANLLRRSTSCENPN
jgi:hypothetical protein